MPRKRIPRVELLADILGRLDDENGKVAKLKQTADIDSAESWETVAEFYYWQSMMKILKEHRLWTAVEERDVALELLRLERIIDRLWPILKRMRNNSHPFLFK